MLSSNNSCLHCVQRMLVLPLSDWFLWFCIFRQDIFVYMRCLLALDLASKFWMPYSSMHKFVAVCFLGFWNLQGWHIYKNLLPKTGASFLSVCHGFLCNFFLVYKFRALNWTALFDTSNLHARVQSWRIWLVGCISGWRRLSVLCKFVVCKFLVQKNLHASNFWCKKFAQLSGTSFWYQLPERVLVPPYWILECVYHPY